MNKNKVHILLFQIYLYLIMYVCSCRGSVMMFWLTKESSNGKKKGGKNSESLHMLLLEELKQDSKALLQLLQFKDFWALSSMICIFLQVFFSFFLFTYLFFLCNIHNMNLAIYTEKEKYPKTLDKKLLNFIV